MLILSCSSVLLGLVALVLQIVRTRGSSGWAVLDHGGVTVTVIGTTQAYTPAAEMVIESSWVPTGQVDSSTSETLTPTGWPPAGMSRSSGTASTNRWSAAPWIENDKVPPPAL
jgi:hypothetical protein